MAAKVSILDYGSGNIFSIRRAVEYAGEASLLIKTPEEVLAADRLILPGTGAFAACMEGLSAPGLDDAIVEFIAKGRPLLGICVGMQLLMTEGHEFGTSAGLDIIPGEVVAIESQDDLPVPHIGWAALDYLRPVEETPFAGLPAHAEYYFLHSFACRLDSDDHVLARFRYGPQEMTAVVCQDNVFGCQFHPEISAEAGMDIYRNFCRL